MIIIKTDKNKTFIYTNIKNEEKLKEIIKNIRALRHYIVKHDGRRFIIELQISAYHKQRIMRGFKKGIVRKKKEMPSIICGHIGCLITGFGLKWL